MIFTTDRLIIRPWEEKDAASLYEYAKDPNVGPIAGWPAHQNVEDSLSVLRNVLMVPNTFAVCLKENNVAIGSIGLIKPEQSHTEAKEDEMEIGYWIGVPFWGNGYIPEAVRCLMQYAFLQLRCEGLWCGYYDGNTKSQRCQEKCGFMYHHTEENKPCIPMNDSRTEHFTYISRDKWINEIYPMERMRTGNLLYCNLREQKERIDVAAAWFSSKWGVPAEAYYECMDKYLKGETEYGWYLCLSGERIVGGLGVIENDFHDRKDLTPNICAVYTEEDCRGRGIAGILLDMVVEELRKKGVSPVYLITDHTSFYERYNWEFYCMVNGDGEEHQSRLYVHR